MVADSHHAQEIDGQVTPDLDANPSLADRTSLLRRRWNSYRSSESDKIRLTGLGILQVQARPARMGRNPATGASIKIAASKKIAFRPGKELKEAV